MRPFIRTIIDTEFDGGSICLDFVNTVRNRFEEPVFEYLLTPGDWIIWVKRKKLVSNEELRKLKAASKNSANEFNQILRCREDFYQMFKAIANDKKPSEKMLETLNKNISYYFKHLSIEIGSNRKVQLKLSTRKNSLLLPLLHVLHSSFELLNSESINRVKECDGCGWIFLDKSKNRSRRWCNMKTCGSTDKTRRYYYKQKQITD